MTDTTKLIERLRYYSMYCLQRNGERSQAMLDAADALEAMQADAERYRWLRQFKRHAVCAIKVNDYHGDTLLFEDELDAAIDTARSKP